MPRLYETVRRDIQLELALRAHTPGRVAQTFAGFASQFYDRSDFDSLARYVGALYDLQSAERASAFRTQLDRRLCDRYHAPVAWDVVPKGAEEAA